MPKVFVYGTLKVGGALNRYLENNGAKFEKKAHTGPSFRLYRVGWHPGMVREEDGPGVHGEIFDVSPDLLDILDDVEATDCGLFLREMITLSDGTEAWTYIYNCPVSHLEEVPDGTWPT